MKETEATWCPAVELRCDPALICGAVSLKTARARQRACPHVRAPRQ